jgi:hypothetical protein
VRGEQVDRALQRVEPVPEVGAEPQVDPWHRLTPAG